ncbi:MAG: HlyD family efflux transporter periplasmic adaptor subunit [Planctomycetaceae bacterium]|nr:HlyD family efflux transporter periplasmic adaptor subunit [Planctomycetaceae bacterium]
MIKLLSRQLRLCHRTSAHQASGFLAVGCGLFVSITALMLPVAAQDKDPAGIRVQSPFFVVRDQADIPALERGNLSRLDVRSGDAVQAEQQLGSLDDREAALALEVARIELQAAEKRVQESRAVEIAEASLAEAVRLLEQTREEASIAEQMAADDSGIRLAEKAEQLAKDHLDRARISRDLSRISVSEQEWFRLQNEYDKQRISTEKARIDQSLAKPRSRSRQSQVEQQRSVVERLQHELQEAKSGRELRQIELQSLKKSVEIAEVRLERRRLTAPFSGVMVEEKKHAGEWVEAGEPVMRLIGLSRLYVEGFASAADVAGIRPGRTVRVIGTLNNTKIPLTGTLVFVSPEVDSNSQVLVRAEVENPEETFRPGERAEMLILPESNSATQILNSDSDRTRR